MESGSRIINCSFGSDGAPSSKKASVAGAWRRFFEKMSREHPGVVFVCAAGNYHTPLSTTNDWPAGAGSGLSNVMIVGNVMNDGTKTADSNTAGGDGEITLAAPGQQAVQGGIDGYMVNENGGTSMAAPQVSAAAALLLALDPHLTADRVKEILSQTARHGPPGIGRQDLGGGSGRARRDQRGTRQARPR